MGSCRHDDNEYFNLYPNGRYNSRCKRHSDGVHNGRNHFSKCNGETEANGRRKFTVYMQRPNSKLNGHGSDKLYVDRRLIGFSKCHNTDSDQYDNVYRDGHHEWV